MTKIRWWHGRGGGANTIAMETNTFFSKREIELELFMYIQNKCTCKEAVPRSIPLRCCHSPSWSSWSKMCSVLPRPQCPKFFSLKWFWNPHIIHASTYQIISFVQITKLFIAIVGYVILNKCHCQETFRLISHFTLTSH